MGLLGGGLATAAYHYRRGLDDQDRRLRDARDMARDARDAIDRWLSSGTAQRLLVATVQDVLGGISIGGPRQQVPSVVPNPSTVTRPDITGVSAATSTQWPPVPGVYDDAGNVTTIGALTRLGLALTYEEVTAAILALVRKASPSQTTKEQIYNVINALIDAVAGRSLTWEQYRAIWENVLASGGALNPHTDATRQPVYIAGSSQATVASVTLLPGSSDEVAFWRVTAGPNPINSGSTLLSATYATPFVVAGQPVKPFVITDNPAFVSIVAASSTSYTVQLIGGSINANSSMDVGVLSKASAQAG